MIQHGKDTDKQRNRDGASNLDPFDGNPQNPMFSFKVVQ
jgi:hypothetical protein